MDNMHHLHRGIGKSADEHAHKGHELQVFEQFDPAQEYVEGCCILVLLHPLECLVVAVRVCAERERRRERGRAGEWGRERERDSERERESEREKECMCV